MTLTFTIGVMATAALAGVFGSLLGLGGGIILVPLFTLALGLPVHTAVAVSLVAVVANAASASVVNLRSSTANLGLAFALAVVTAIGSVSGGFLATSLSGVWLTGLFGVTLVGVALIMVIKPEGIRRPAPTLSPGNGDPTPPAAAAGAGDTPPADSDQAWLDAGYYDLAVGERVAYRPREVRRGLFVSFVAGNLSGLLGIGGGIVQVPLMNLLLGVPMKAATATSSLIISLTAASGAFVYLARGYAEPMLTAATVTGIYIGARGGARLAHHLPGAVLKRIFSVVLFYMAVRMLAQAFNLPFPF